MRVETKPLSVNEARQGKKYKTPSYKSYEMLLLLILPRHLLIPDGKLTIHLEFGQSSKLADWDNPIKPFVDVLQKAYGFNDNRIYRGIVDKVIVPKGSEYIKFNIEEHTEKKVL